MKNSLPIVSAFVLSLLGATACGAGDASPVDDPGVEALIDDPGVDAPDNPDSTNLIHPVVRERPAEDPTTNPSEPVEEPPSTTPEDPQNPEESADCLDVLFAPFPELLDADFYHPIRVGDVRQAVNTMLSSPGDNLTLNLGGEIDIPIPNPFVPTLAVGGEVDLGVSVSMVSIDDPPGVAYELEVSAEKAASANVSAGIAGAGLGSASGQTVIWRFATRDELVDAIGRLAVLSVMNANLSHAVSTLNAHAAELEAGLATLRQVRTTVSNFFAGWLPLNEAWRLERLRVMEARHAQLMTALDLLETLSAWASGSRDIFLEHFARYEVELGLEAEATIGSKVLETGGESAGVLGLQFSGDVKRSLVVGIDTPNAGIGASADVAIVFAGEADLDAGLAVAGISGEMQRKIVVLAEGIITAGGISIESVDPTATVLVDRAFDGALGVGVTGQYGVGRQASLTVDLEDLLAHGAGGVERLLNGAPEEAAALIADLPVACEGQARIRRGFGFGGGFEVAPEWAGAQLYATGFWTDSGQTMLATGLPTADAVGALLAGGAAEAHYEDTLALLDAVGEEVVQLTE